MAVLPPPDVNNTWRTRTPGDEGWARSARPDADDKFFMASADGHVQEPATLWHDRVAEEYHDRLPGIIMMKGGRQAQKTEGFRQPLAIHPVTFEGHDKLRNQSGRTPAERIADLALDGVDALGLEQLVGGVLDAAANFLLALFPSADRNRLDRVHEISAMLVANVGPLN